MALKQHPWDKVIKYKDWQENVPEEDTPVEKASTPSPVSNAAIEALVPQISGINVESPEQADSNSDDILSMIHNLNKGNLDYVEKRKTAEEEKHEEEENIQAQEHQEKIDQRNAEQYDREQAEFDKMAFEKHEEEAKKAAEIQAQKEKSIFYKASNLFKPKKTNTPGKEKEDTEEDTEETDELTEETPIPVDTTPDTSALASSLLGDDDNSLHMLSGTSETTDVDSSTVVVESVGVRHKNKKGNTSAQKVQVIDSSEKQGDDGNDIPSDTTDINPDMDSDTDSYKEDDSADMSSAQGDTDSVDVPDDLFFAADDETVSSDTGFSLNDAMSEDAVSEETETGLTEEPAAETDNTDFNHSQPDIISDSIDEDSDSDIGNSDEEKKIFPIDEYDADENKPEPAKEVSSNADKKSAQKHKKSFFGFGRKKEDIPAEEHSSKHKKTTGDKDPDWQYLATHDELTGLLNQRVYEEFKKSDIQGVYVIAMIDINNLKYTNDTYGHAAGNNLITAVSDQIKTLFPDCGYRIGGDEFVIFVRYKNVKKAESDFLKKKETFHSALKARTSKEYASGLVYSASLGYAISDGEKDFAIVSDEADKLMYAEKKAYKEAHPEFNMRGAAEPFKNTPAPAQAPTNPEDYDNMLSKDQRELKQYVQDNHIQVSQKSTQEIIREIQSRSSEIVAILIASPTFDQLFILLSAQTFIGVCNDVDSLIDYSYFYIMYKSGPQYKGSDEYLLQVKQVFEAIGNGILSGQIKSEKEILKIKGINIFKNIYVGA